MALIETLPVPGGTPPAASFQRDCDCDDLPGARGAISAPLVVYSTDARFDIGLKQAGTISAAVRACAFSDHCRAQVFRSEHQWRPDGLSGTLSLALIPNALNCVTLARLDANGKLSAPAEWWIYPRAGFGLLPPGFHFLLWLDVTDAELNDELAKLIAEVSKVSKELAEFLKDHVEYSDDPENHTTLIDPTGGKTKANTHILINKAAIKAALALIKAANDDDRPGMEEQLFRQLLDVLLHEASHRKAIVDGTYRDGAQEEDRNTTALIQRLIDLLKKLKTNLPTAPAAGKQALGDGEGLKDEDIAKWMERLREVVKGEKVYRFAKVAGAVQPWKDKKDHLKRKWNDFKRKLAEIKNDNLKNAAQKQAAAQAALDAFNSDVSADKAALQQEFDVTLDFGFDQTTFEPSANVTPTDNYKGAAIP